MTATPKVPDPTPEDLAQEANPDLFDPDQTFPDEPVGALPDDPTPAETGVTPIDENQEAGA